MFPNIRLNRTFAILLLFYPGLTQQRFCKTEYSQIPGGGNVTWSYKDEPDDKIFFSDPPCLDHNGYFITRTCTKGQWHPTKPPLCFNVENGRGKCPWGFLSSDDLCVYITEPQRANGSCPIPGSAFDIINRLQIEQDIWLPVRRNENGQLEYLTERNYGKAIGKDFELEKSYNKTDILHLNCVTVSGNYSYIKQTDCVEEHPHICVYHYDHFLYSCPPNWIGGGLGSQKCFGRMAQCDHKANPVSPYEKKILAEFKGECSGEDSSGPFSISYQRHWNVSCELCQTKAVDFPKIEMLLYQNSQKLFLIVYSPEGLFRGFHDNKNPVYCFTNAFKTLKERVKIKSVYYNRLNLTKSYQVFKIGIDSKLPGEYWCEGFQLPNVTVVKSNVVLVRSKPDFSYRLKVAKFCKEVQECDPSTSNYYTDVADLVEQKIDFDVDVRVMKIYSLEFGNLDVLVHITPRSTKNLVKTYYRLQNALRGFDGVFLRSSEACLPESGHFNWGLTPVGSVAIPEKLCVQLDGKPVIRKCEGNFLFGAFWGEIQGTCSGNFSNETKLLYDLDKATDYLAENISGLTDNLLGVTVLDVHLITRIFEKILFKPDNANYVMKTIDNVMNFNKSILREAQFLLNSTDEFLDAIGKVLDKIPVNDSLSIKEPNFIIHITKPFLTNISGLALCGGLIQNVTLNSTVENILQLENLEIAVYVPETLLKDFSENKSETEIKIITTIFNSDTLFNANGSNAVGSKIVSVTISGHDGFLKSPIPIFFKSAGQFENCAFWNFASNDRKGNWATIGGDHLGSNGSVEICSFSHLTHFALLITTEKVLIDEAGLIAFDEYELHDSILSVITIIGCTLSLIGILGIFLSAVLFQQWREKIGTKVLLHLSVAITLEISMFVANNSFSETACMVIGILLHYSILSKFCWMLVTAFLQLFRFVQVLGTAPSHIILKGVLIGWTLPLIPVLMAAVLSPESYFAGIQRFCYPKNLTFYLSVFLPVAIIMAINVGVFCKVMQNVLCSKMESYKPKSDVKRKLYLAVLLSFLLGLPWIFGFLSEISNSQLDLRYAFMYLFCIGGTLQGFVLFLFYVVLDKSTRLMWYKLFK